MDNTPKWIRDLEHMTTELGFGEIVVHRHRSKTDTVTFYKSSQIKPKSNISAFKDLEKLLNSMIFGLLEGKLEFEIDFKKGTIVLITIKNKEIKNYGQSTSSQ